jgi:hypothetical protein
MFIFSGNGDVYKKGEEIVTSSKKEKKLDA